MIFQLRDLLDEGRPSAGGATLILDGEAYEVRGGTLGVELPAGAHDLVVRHQDYRADLVVLRFEGEAEPRAQAVGTQRLSFEVRSGDVRADVLLVPRSLDVAFFRSLLDEGISRRWTGQVDLHIDLTASDSKFVLSVERAGELAAFVKDALEELSGGAVTLGGVTTGTGLGWADFLRGERPGAITLQLGYLAARTRGSDVGGLALYRDDPSRPGVIRSANIILDVNAVRASGSDFRPRLGHEIGHAVSLQHPSACRRWSRMDPGTVACDQALSVDLIPGTFWSPADREAGKLIHAFLPGTDFKALPVVPLAP